LLHGAVIFWQCVKIVNVLILKKLRLIPSRVNTFINMLIHEL